MKNLTKIVLLTLFLQTNYFAQADTCKNFVTKISGDTLYGKVELTEPILSRTYITFNDSIEIKPDSVTACFDGKNYYVTVKNAANYNVFVKRIKEGRLELFTDSKTYYTPGNNATFNTPGGTHSINSPGSFYTVNWNYMRKDGGPVMERSIGNLKEAMADYKPAYNEISSYQTLTWVKWGFLVTGAAIITSAIVKAANGTKPGPAPIIGGAIVMNLAWIPAMLQEGKVDRAVRLYNGIREEPQKKVSLREGSTPAELGGGIKR